MLQQLSHQTQVTPEVVRFINALSSSGFQGDIATDELSLAIHSTDNSIWQVIPQAVITPKSTRCVEQILKVLSEESHRSISITARGGGTSTAGQSLTSSVVLDCKKYLNRVLDYDPSSEQVHVECGAVLQTINDELRDFGVMIGPTVATATRATIGGMLGNDSAGKGSRIYGKTSDCIVELETVLRGGVRWNSREVNREALTNIEQSGGLIGEIHSAVHNACELAKPHLPSHWPVLPRFVSGYNLPMAWTGSSFNLNRILCGSEGTLGITTTARLQCVPIPIESQLLLLCLDSMDSALQCGAILASHDPSAIEVIDDLVLETARDDKSWSQVESLLGHHCDNIKAILFVEFSHPNCHRISDAREHTKQMKGLVACKVLRDADEMDVMWRFRSRCVGLLSSLSGTRKPIPFVEDCAVPPESLADFIREFRALLTHHGLRAGMFGHVDAGVIHVRPALDMQDSVERDLVRIVSDEVNALVRKFNGVLWGEHGKGFRSEFGPKVFGNEIWQQMCNIKVAFDPFNQFNPGKVAVPNVGDQISSMCAPTRGARDAPLQVLPVISKVTSCDGNSDCQSASLTQRMCPTYRVSGDPIHSPRGRAEVLRHWISRIGTAKIETHSSFTQKLMHSGRGSDISHSVRQALDGCLSCKACATDCPMQIDISSIRSHFYHAYFGRYLRPIRDIIWLQTETLLPLLASTIGSFIPATTIARRFGIVDPPHIVTPTLAKQLKKCSLRTSSPAEIVQLKPTVVLLQDSFTTFYRPSVFLSMLEILEKINIRFAILPLKPCGKAHHVRGALAKFKYIASRNTDWIAPIQQAKIPIIGIDPAATLLWRDEYPQILGVECEANYPLLPQEWLANQDLKQIQIQGTWKLFTHCIEKAIASDSDVLWKKVFSDIGADLQCIETACCGMGGLFGHQKEHLDMSHKIWEMHWAPHKPTIDHALVTGYSCYSQAKRIMKTSLLHPLEVIATYLPSSL